jgi:hypothetical protein
MVKGRVAPDLEEVQVMGIFATLRKGFSFFLMSMGVATYPKKAQPPPPEAPKPPVS